MPKFLQKRWHGYQTVWAFLLLLVLVICISMYNWELGVMGLLLSFLLGGLMLKTELIFVGS